MIYIKVYSVWRFLKNDKSAGNKFPHTTSMGQVGVSGLLTCRSKALESAGCRLGRGVLSLPNDRGGPPRNYRKAPFLGKKLDELPFS